MGKLTGNQIDMNNKPAALYFLMSLFMAVGVVFTIMYFTSNQNMIFLIVAGVFYVIGFAILPYAIHRHKKMKEYRSLLKDETAFITTARFVDSKFSSIQRKTFIGIKNSYTIGFTVFRRIVYSYIDENGVQRTGKSQITYVKNQVEYLRDKGEFAIKCKGDKSVIVEPVPENTKNFNL